MWGLPSAPDIFTNARYLVWISFLKLLSTVVGGVSNLLNKLDDVKPREFVSEADQKLELPNDVEEESLFEEAEELEPPPKVDPLNIVLSDDVLPEILKHLDADSLKSSRLVSRHWCQLATPILASKVQVNLYTVDKCFTFRKGSERPSSFNLGKSRHVNHFKSFIAWRESKKEASDRRLISFQHFKLTFASMLWELEAIPPLTMRLFLMPQVQESLVSLTAQGHYLGWLRFSLGNLPHLKSLKLECDWYQREGHFAMAVMTPQNHVYAETGNFPDLPKLEEFSVVQDKYFFHESQSWHWILAASPNLTALDLKIAAEPDMFSALEPLIRLYRGIGLQRLEIKINPGYVRDRSRFALVLHQILSSDRISPNLKYFSCDVFLTPQQWAGIFTTTKTNRPLGSPLETLDIIICIRTPDSRAEFVNDFLLFCPTFSGEAYLRRLKSLSLSVVDISVRKTSSRSTSSDKESSTSSSEPIQFLKSSIVLPHLKTLEFHYNSNVPQCQLLSQTFFQPFSNLKSFTTTVVTRKCVTIILRHLPLGLNKLFLWSTSEYMFSLKIDDICVYLINDRSTEDPLPNMESSEVTDELVFCALEKFRNLKGISFETFPVRLTADGWKLQQQAGIVSLCKYQGRTYRINFEGAIKWQNELKISPSLSINEVKNTLFTP